MGLSHVGIWVSDEINKSEGEEGLRGKNSLPLRATSRAGPQCKKKREDDWRIMIPVKMQ